MKYKLNNNYGATLLEFAITVPILFLFCFAILDFSHVFTQRAAIARAVKIAGRAIEANKYNYRCDLYTDAKQVYYQELGRPSDYVPTSPEEDFTIIINPCSDIGEVSGIFAIIEVKEKLTCFSCNLPISVWKGIDNFRATYIFPVYEGIPEEPPGQQICIDAVNECDANFNDIDVDCRTDFFTNLSLNC